MWFERRVSIIAARVMRAITAIWGRASVATGRTRLRSEPPPQPPTGSQARTSPKTICSIGATTKFGTVRPMVPKPVTA